MKNARTAGRTRVARMGKIKVVLALVIPFVGLIALLVAAGSNGNAAGDNLTKQHRVEVLPLSVQASYQQKSVIYGTVEARQEAVLGFEFAGVLTQLNVNEGNAVEAGAELARLDTARIDAQLQELQASLDKAEAQLTLAKLTQTRVIDLQARNLESQQRVDEVAQQVTSARASINEIKARIERLGVERAKSGLIAPFSGYVTTQLVDVGSVVNPGQPVVTLREAGALELRLPMPANQANTLTQGQTLTVFNQSEEIAATVRSVSRSRNVRTRTRDVILTLPQHKDDIYPGDILSFEHYEPIERAGAWLPKSALSSGVRGMWTIYTVADTESQRVAATSVEVLYQQDDRVYVTGNLNNKDYVVASGVHRLVPNQQVYAAIADSHTLAGESHNDVAL